MPAERTKATALRQTTLTFAKSSAQTAVTPVFASSPTTNSEARPRPSKPVDTAKPKAKPKAARDDRTFTDAILSIKPEFTQLISERRKNHEYRKYKLKESVTRLWLYETAPTSAITYVMLTTTPKVPGEVNDPSGIGNDEFDQGLKKSKYGYPVTELYRLQKPLTTSELKSRFGIAVPQGWRYATKQLVEEMPLDAMEKVF